MNSKGFTYLCPNADQCPIRKRCHVLTTVMKLTGPIMVRQICPALGRGQDGRKREIKITIG